MSDERRPGVIGSLPSTRPHRRSDKRGPVAARPAAEKTPAAKPAKAAPKPASRKPTAKQPTTAKATAKKATVKKPVAKKPPANVRTRTVVPPPPPPVPATADERAGGEQHGTLETVVLAAAELTELGLRAGARALRSAVSRLPRP